MSMRDAAIRGAMIGGGMFIVQIIRSHGPTCLATLKRLWKRLLSRPPAQ